MIKRMIIMLLAVGVVLGAVFGFQVLKSHLIAKALADYAAAPQTVSATTAAYQDWQPTLRAVATLRASRGVDIAPEMPGIVDTISFESGQDVTAGTLLLTLRPNDAESRLKQLQAMQDLAEITYKRDQQQFRDRVVSQATLDADLANLKSARAQVDAQKSLMEQKTIRAPFDGRLGIRQVDLGQYLNPGTPIVTLQALDPIYADFYVPQQALAQISVGQTLDAHVDAVPKRSFAGRITAINAKVDTGSRNVLVRATLENADHQLLPGMYAQVEIATGQKQRLLTLPQTAIAFNAYGSTVFLLEEQGKDDKGEPKLTAQQTFVTTGPTRGDQVAVLSGVNEGQTVVTAGQIKLRNGTAVVVDNTVQPGASAAPTLQLR
ncbi:MAG: efflux RND transporter periplasmic adaptor subunit [Acetobacteraceae bacterium]